MNKSASKKKVVKASKAVAEAAVTAPVVESAPTTVETPAPSIIAVKGFDANMRCRGYQYAIGDTYEHNGPVTACESGFHSVEFPPDVFGYYPPATSLYAEVEASGEIARHNDDSKVASGRLHVRVALSIPDIVSRTIAWILARCEPAKAQHATGDRSASSATGDRSASSATGYQSASSATGYQSASSATGYQSASSATGYQSASLNTGSYSSSEIKSADDGKPLQAVAIATGYQSKARAPAGSAIVLVERDDNGAILHIRASKVGENGVKPDTWMTLRGGEFVEVAEGS